MTDTTSNTGTHGEAPAGTQPSSAVRANEGVNQATSSSSTDLTGPVALRSGVRYRLSEFLAASGQPLVSSSSGTMVLPQMTEQRTEGGPEHNHGGGYRGRRSGFSGFGTRSNGWPGPRQVSDSQSTESRPPQAGYTKEQLQRARWLRGGCQGPEPGQPADSADPSASIVQEYKDDHDWPGLGHKR